MLHGLGGTKGSFLPTVAALADSYRAIAIDLPGFGDSVKPLGAAYDPRFFAKAVCGLLDALGLDRAHLIGNRMGGRVALEVGFEHPDRVGQLVAARPVARLAARPPLGAAGAGAAAGARADPARAAADGRADRAPLRPRRRDGWAAVGVDEFLRAYLTPRGRAAFYAARAQHLPRRARGRRRLLDAAARAASATSLFVWGRHDRLVPIAFARHVAEALPRRQHLELDCGHVPQLEAPKETHAAVRRFLAAHRRAAGGGVRGTAPAGFTPARTPGCPVVRRSRRSPPAGRTASGAASRRSAASARRSVARTLRQPVDLEQPGAASVRRPPRPRHPSSPSPRAARARPGRRPRRQRRGGVSRRWRAGRPARVDAELVALAVDAEADARGVPERRSSVNSVSITPAPCGHRETAAAEARRVEPIEVASPSRRSSGAAVRSGPSSRSSACTSSALVSTSRPSRRARRAPGRPSSATRRLGSMSATATRRGRCAWRCRGRRRRRAAARTGRRTPRPVGGDAAREADRRPVASARRSIALSVDRAAVLDARALGRMQNSSPLSRRPSSSAATRPPCAARSPPPERRVAGVVAADVVELLEVVDVAEQQRRPRRRARARRRGAPRARAGSRGPSARPGARARPCARTARRGRRRRRPGRRSCAGSARRAR